MGPAETSLLAVRSILRDDLGRLRGEVYLVLVVALRTEIVEEIQDIPAHVKAHGDPLDQPGLPVGVHGNVSSRHLKPAPTFRSGTGYQGVAVTGRRRPASDCELLWRQPVPGAVFLLEKNLAKALTLHRVHVHPDLLRENAQPLAVIRKSVIGGSELRKLFREPHRFIDPSQPVTRLHVHSPLDTSSPPQPFGQVRAIRVLPPTGHALVTTSPFSFSSLSCSLRK